MRQARIVMALVISGLAWTAGGRRPMAGPVSVNVDIGVFHDALAPYGDWIETARFGVVWAPARVDHGWRPYTRGTGSSPISAGHGSATRSGVGPPIITAAGPSTLLTAGSGPPAPSGGRPGWPGAMAADTSGGRRFRPRLASTWRG